MEYGGRHPTVTMFVMSTFFVMALSVSLLFAFILPTSTPSWGIFVIIVACTLFGMGTGYGVFNWPKVGVVLIGLFMGSLLGTIIYSVFFSGIDTQLQNNHDMNIYQKIDNSAEL